MNPAIESFKSKHRGQRVFLIGNGPSLSRTPLDLIAGEQSFAMNRISLIYPKTTWRPSYFICTTTNITRPEWKADIDATLASGTQAFFWEDLRQYAPIDAKISFIRCSHGPELVEEAPDEWWSDDATDRVCKFGTSMLVALQIAAYMGFSKMYLLGCDLGFKPDPVTRPKMVVDGPRIDPNHFDPNYGTPGWPHDKLNMNMLAAHRMAKRNCDRLGIEVFNATPGGELEVYPRADFATVMRHSKVA